MKKTLLSLGIAALFAISALAADVNGKWSGEVEGRNGKRPVSMELKADGATLTGSVSGPGGRVNPISDGKLDGDNISFTVAVEFNGNAFKMLYSGVVSGDTIQFKQTREGADRAVEFTVKRSQ